MANILATLLTFALVLNIALSSSTPEAVEEKCPFKGRFYYDNRICTCSKETNEIECKDRVNEYKDELQVTQLQSVNVTCEPASLFDLDCSHTCVCDAEGSSALCTYSHKQCTDEQTKELLNQCTPGSILNDDCNTCVCDESGKPVCTKLDCDLAYSGSSPNGEVICVPDTSYVLQCNDCDCTLDGQESYCNKMGCSPFYPVYHESLTNVTTSCEPKKKYESGCQECYCGDSGTYALCVGIECGENSEPTNTIEKCLPGSIVANDCNSCVCNDDGKAVCTKLSCDLKFNKV
ncbi:laminin subunit alpha-1-like [Trichogramma pretiosum]|uniref:laminin subunit alpha-1-like n=1 Tax=Trichogramma pretiosum TaxID=7493 RepID=UPI000C71B7B2|nr:laminin subunit alpha-1-like [Trichogramma pretiosum]